MNQDGQRIKEDRYRQAEELAQQVMHHARDSILMNMRFLDVAVSAVKPEAQRGLGGFACDGKKLYYDPLVTLKRYQEEPAFCVRLYLHVLLHLIFYHSFRYDRLNRERWSLAADIAVEAVILELALPLTELKSDQKKRESLRGLREEVSAPTAEKLYRCFTDDPAWEGRKDRLARLFEMDRHLYWEPAFANQQQWQKMSQRVQTAFQSFSRRKTGSESIEANLTEALRDRYRYSDLLRRFMVMNEDMQVNDDEFDYIYYTYGLDHYGNMPLVEPLEYKDSKKIREFVVAIDTSASCRGELVQAFLRKTYGLLSGEDNFFRRMNVHIIQCDYQVQKDTKITGRQELDFFLEHEKLIGFGSTDFRPVFAYVEELLRKGEFENLKGLLYFTDGYGVYPEKMPPYEVMFVFPDKGDQGPEVPPWAVKVLLDYEELSEREK